MTLTLPRTGTPAHHILSTMTPDLTNVINSANVGGASAAQATANLAYFYPVRVDETRTYQKAWWLNGATAAGNVDVGIYTVSGTTATRVVACTAEAQSGVSAMQVAATFTTTTLTPGLYYLAISNSLGTATFWRANPAVAFPKAAGVYIATTAHPLPSTATVTSPSSAFLPVFGFSELATL